MGRSSKQKNRSRKRRLSHEQRMAVKGLAQNATVELLQKKILEQMGDESQEAREQRALFILALEKKFNTPVGGDQCGLELSNLSSGAARTFRL